MKPPFLLACAAFFNGLSALPFTLILGLCALPTRNRLLWPVAFVLFPLALPLLFLWPIAQIISSLCAFAFHQLAGTRASVRNNGLHLKTTTAPQVVKWQDIRLIRRIYERAFGEYKTRFSGSPAYQFLLQSGENLIVDFTDEAALLAKAGAQGIATEGFDSHLAASKFESSLQPNLRSQV